MDYLTQSIFEESLFLIPEKTWVILSKPWHDTTAEERSLLEKILSAVGLTLDGVIIQYQHSFNLNEWPIKPFRVLYFGTAAKGIPQNEVISIDGSDVIVSSPLNNLHTDAAVKQKLWQALKLLFKTA